MDTDELTYSTMFGNKIITSSIFVNTASRTFELNVEGTGRITSTFTSTIGVGTLAPAQMLDVIGGAHISSGLFLDTNVANGGLQLQNSGGTSNTIFIEPSENLL